MKSRAAKVDVPQALTRQNTSHYCTSNETCFPAEALGRQCPQKRYKAFAGFAKALHHGQHSNKSVREVSAPDATMVPPERVSWFAAGSSSLSVDPAFVAERRTVPDAAPTRDGTGSPVPPGTRRSAGLSPHLWLAAGPAIWRVDRK
jgi:hypothetical protein